MTPRRFAWLLGARGADLAAWSVADRTEALLLLRTDPPSRAALADALADEELPAADQPVAADAASLGRMRDHVRRALAPPPPVLRGIRMGALVACVAAGFYLGLLPMDPEPVAASASGVASSMDGSMSATVLAALDP